MEDRHITGGNGHVLLATLTVPGTLTDAIPSEPPRYALHDDMRMPDRLLLFDCFPVLAVFRAIGSTPPCVVTIVWTCNGSGRALLPVLECHEPEGVLITVRAVCDGL